MGIYSCACGSEKASKPCHLSNWHCIKPCGKTLACGRHVCEQICHSGVLLGSVSVPQVVIVLTTCRQAVCRGRYMCTCRQAVCRGRSWWFPCTNVNLSGPVSFPAQGAQHICLSGVYPVCCCSLLEIASARQRYIDLGNCGGSRANLLGSAYAAL